MAKGTVALLADPAPTATWGTVTVTATAPRKLRFASSAEGTSVVGHVVADAGGKRSTGRLDVMATAPVSTRPKAPPAAANTLRVPEDHGTLAAAMAAASPGDHVSLADGNYGGVITLDEDRGTGAKVVIRSRTPFGAVFTGRLVAQNGRGFWFHELAFTGQFSEGEFCLTPGSFCNVTRCRIAGRNGIGVLNFTGTNDGGPTAPKRDVRIGWCDFVGQNTAGINAVSHLKFYKNDNAPSGQIEFKKIDVYDCYFNDDAPANQGLDETFHVYLGNTQIGSGDVPRFPNFRLERLYFSPKSKRNRAIYLKHGITHVLDCHSRMPRGSAFTQRHGWGTRWLGCRGEDTQRIGGMILGGGGTSDLFTDVRGCVIAGEGAFRVECGWVGEGRSRPRHQAAHHILLAGNTGSLKLGFNGGVFSPDDGGAVKGARIWQHSGTIDEFDSETLDTASMTVSRASAPLGLTIPTTVTLSPSQVGLELSGERSA